MDDFRDKKQEEESSSPTFSTGARSPPPLSKNSLKDSRSREPLYSTTYDVSSQIPDKIEIKRNINGAIYTSSAAPRPNTPPLSKNWVKPSRLRSPAYSTTYNESKTNKDVTPSTTIGEGRQDTHPWPLAVAQTPTGENSSLWNTPLKGPRWQHQCCWPFHVRYSLPPITYTNELGFNIGRVLENIFQSRPDYSMVHCSVASAASVSRLSSWAS